jgi:LuxR family maltose regulon positive regulatory protein
MASPILVTKLFIPTTRPELVSRPRLIEKLDRGLNRKLTLISAPAGFGKTTLVSEWVGNLGLVSANKSRRKYKTAWLSLDEGDNDLARFLVYLIVALNRAAGSEAALGESAQAMLQSPQLPTEAILTSLINEVSAIPDEIVFVLDDYHVTESPPVDDALTFLIEHLPPQLHLVTITRVDPQFSLARLRAQNQLTELRATDLRFTSFEAVDFLNRVMGLDLSAENIAALETRTEGWIAGLQLAAISMQGQEDHTGFIKSFTGSHQFVLDYLLEEVLEQRPEDVQNFLMKTAILNRLTGSLCDALVDQDDGQAILEMLNDANLFIVPLDDERRWFRYHHLFADLLRQRLRLTYPKQIPILHQRASDWYEQNGFIGDAIEHALNGEAFERAANLIEDQFGVKYERGDHTQIRRWLAALPEELVCSKPYLCILHAWNLFTSGQLDAADRSLQVAEQMLGLDTDQTPVDLLEPNQLSETDRRTLLGRASAIWAFIASYSGDVPSTIQYARRALENLPERELSWRGAASIALGDAFMSQGDMQAAYEARSESLVTARATGDTYLLMIASLRLAETLRQQGKLQQVIEICQQQMQSAKDSGISESVVTGWLFGIWGEVLAEFNELDDAEEKAKKGVELTGRGKDVAMIGWSNLCLFRVLFSRGDFTSAEELIQGMGNIAREHDIPIWIPVQLSAWQARLWLKQDKLEVATRWAEERGLAIKGNLSYLHEFEHIVLARILIAEERFEKATELLERLLEGADAGGRTSRAIEILILQALSLQKQGDTSQAIAVMEKALTLAEPGGFIRTFVDEGSSIARLLYETLSRGIVSDYVQRLLAAFPEIEPEKIGSPKSQNLEYELIESLSEREIEVLQLMAEGLTNPEIASRLYVSLNTVKVHSRNIYAKLGVNNRTQAGTRAKALGILPPT